MTTSAAGDLLDGRYRLTERIGSGGMGTVFRAHDDRLDRTVAVKLIHPGREVDEVTRARLQAEARFAGALQHPGIVQVFDYGEAPGPTGPTPYVVMQYVDGTPLSEVLRENGALPADTVAALLRDVAAALEVAHAGGIVHRDLKPSNIIVTGAGRAVLVDFGVARSDTAEPLTETGQIIGSVDYLSPEQVRGQRAMPASDVYALGVVAHQCLSAVSPFRRETQAATLLARLHDEPPTLGPDVPSPMRALVASMLSSEPDERPTAAEVVRRVAALDKQPTVVLPPMPPTPAKPAGDQSGRSRRRLVIVAAAAALALAIGLGVILLPSDDTTPPAGASSEAVPGVRGEPVAQAVRELKAAGYAVTRRPVDGTDARGTVVRQSPGPGPYDGDTVVLHVATGFVELDSADLLGTTYAAGVRVLRGLGLTATRAERPSAAAAGTVVWVDPGGRIRIGSPVTLTVATAIAPRAPIAHHAPKPPKAPKHHPGKGPKPKKHGHPKGPKKKH
ncbi:protein kinase [Nocardioides sp. CN2-186]|uniref:serine/threonine protein kinase n=1 Tax=Nocardioides tweenelious TaxID=3156607 RepID=UPI0032B497BA